MLVTIGSVTAATRTARTLERATGIKIRVVHTPSAINHGGCSYSILFPDKYEAIVRNEAAKRSLYLRKWYSDTPDKFKYADNDLS